MKCLLDMDGVLVDFVRGALKAHDRDPETPITQWGIHTLLGMSEAQFWAPLSDWHFWANLGWTQEGRQILDLVESKFGPMNICLCSTPSWAPGSLAGKLMWIEKHVPEYLPHYWFGKDKSFLAGPDKVLIDDNWESCVKFGEAGGHKIIVPRPWNHAGQEAGVDVVRAVRLALDKF